MRGRVGNSLVAGALAVSMVLAGCGTSTPVGSPGASSSLPAGTSYGVVESIQPRQASGPSGVGAAVGSVLGTLLGYKIGSGSGQVAATAAGAAGGALAGGRVEQNRKQQGYQVGVRLDNGSYTSVTQTDVADLSVGNRVRIDDGRLSRY